MAQDGTISVVRGTSSSGSGGNQGTVLGTLTDFVVLPNVFYHLEMKAVIHDTTGAVQVWINEVEKLNLTNQDTQNVTGVSTVNQITLENVTNASDANITDFDDVVIRDDQQNGDEQVRCFFPTGVGATDQWTASAGTTAQCVDETAPNDDTDFISESTPGDISVFTFDDLGPTSSITAVVPLPYAKKTDAGTAKLKNVIRHSGINYSGDEKAPSNSAYEYLPQVFMTNPGTSNPFSVSDWNALEVGVEREA
jgi:hypothetical protein